MKSEAERQYQRHWSKTEKGRASRRSWENRNRGRIRGYYERYKAEGKTYAYCVVREALERSKVLRQPCEVCGDKNAHGHHDDYAKPLELRWLCPIHHKELHRLMNGMLPEPPPFLSKEEVTVLKKTIL